MSSSAERRISLALRRVARKLSKELRNIAGKNLGFTLVVYSDQDEGMSSFVSNCARKDTIKGLDRLLEHLKSDMPDIPLHERH